jgi:hypothetical protein
LETNGFADLSERTQPSQDDVALVVCMLGPGVDLCL